MSFFKRRKMAAAVSAKLPAGFPSFRRASHLVVVLGAICISWVASVPADYLTIRRRLIESEQSMRLGGDGSTLNAGEQRVNEAMLQEKRALIEAARLNGSDFAARHNFLDVAAKKAMESTRSFNIIRKMPKGAVLHIHDEALTSIDWLVKNVTYRPNCYMCVDNSYNVKFHFFNSPPANQGCTWRLISDYRAQAADVTAFDQTLHNNITMVTADPLRAYPDINAVWVKFMDYFFKVEGLILYRPVFEDYLWEGLEQYRQDNVQYIEIRALCVPLYELDGSSHDADWVLALYKRVIDRFERMYANDFIGVKIIKASLRIKSEADILTEVKQAMKMYQNYPGFVVGYDLVAQEDLFHPLIYYIDALLYPSQQNPPVYLPYFFHAGETNWQDTATDYNLVDAVLLNTTRIGHGYALYKHPKLMEWVKSHDIAIEVNPISNQVLKLVEDPRNHPVTALMAQNMPVVISCDDNAAWEALPLTHDFYVTFMALTGEDTGLATLKQLVKNSIKYSALNHADKQAGLRLWQRKWDAFIRDVASQLPFK